MHRRPRRNFKFQPRHDQLESRRLLSTVYSTNWSGYGAATNLSSPATGSVTAVSGSWVVPTVTAPRRGTYYSSAWVGIDGLSDSTVEQIGTEQDVSKGTAHYDAWWEMYSSGLGQPEQVISGFKIKPGDSITASVQYTGSGNFALKITDTTENESFTTTQNTNVTQSPTASQSSAEWIVEAPSVGGRQASLANFGTITFSNASATINPGSGAITGPINDSAWQNEAIDMITSRGACWIRRRRSNSARHGIHRDLRRHCRAASRRRRGDSAADSSHEPRLARASDRPGDDGRILRCGPHRPGEEGRIRPDRFVAVALTRGVLVGGWIEVGDRGAGPRVAPLLPLRRSPERIASPIPAKLENASVSSDLSATRPRAPHGWVAHGP